MSDPSKRFLTIVLALGVAVLIVAIVLGQRMGDRVLGQITEKRLESIAPVTVTPAPVDQTYSGPFGPAWRREQVLAAASDPGFPDPRVPPVPIPTATPAPKYTPAPRRPTPSPTPTPNLNLPIWRRAAPLPTPTPVGSESPSPAASATGAPAAIVSPQPNKSSEP